MTALVITVYFCIPSARGQIARSPHRIVRVF